MRRPIKLRVRIAKKKRNASGWHLVLGNGYKQLIEEGETIDPEGN